MLYLLSKPELEDIFLFSLIHLPGSGKSGNNGNDLLTMFKKENSYLFISNFTQKTSDSFSKI